MQYHPHFAADRRFDISFSINIIEGDITISKKRRFKQRQKQEFEISSPKQQAIQNDRILYIDEDSVTETLEATLEKCEELGRNLTDEEFKEIFEKKMRMKAN